MNNNVLVLGAGIYQLNLIRVVRQLGFSVHVASRAGQYPGIHLADQFHEVDTTDREGILALCETIHPALVLTSGSDVCIPTLGYVNERLSLPGIHLAAAETISSKALFREFQKRHGLNPPSFCASHNVNEAWNWFQLQNQVMLVKPSSSSGSRGIFKMEPHVDKNYFHECFQKASAFSLSNVVCMEAVLPGTEVGGNAIVSHGKCVFLAVSEKHLEGFLVRGHKYPSFLTPSSLKQIRDTLELTCGKLDYCDGPLNFDLMVDGENIHIIELGARFGGNGLVDLCNLAYGTDIERSMVQTMISQEPLAAFPEGVSCACGSYVFGANSSGILHSMVSENQLKSHLPWVCKVCIQRNPREEVNRMDSNADQIGYAVFDIPSHMSWRECCDAIQSHLNIIVEK